MCDSVFTASSTSYASFPTNYESSVKSTATQSASSNISLEEAKELSKKLANEKANSVAENDAAIINQSLDIVNEKFIQPLNNFQDSVTSSNNIRLDQVVDSLNAFKKAVYNVNYLANLINTHSEEIIKAGRYDTILKPIVEKEYYNNGEDFWTYSVADFKCYFEWEKYQFWNNLTLDEMIEYNNENNLSEYNELLISENQFKKSELEKLIQENPNQDRYTNILVGEWKNGLKIYYTQYQKDLLRPNEWIMISCGIYLDVFLPNTDNLDLFSKEYSDFINLISNELSLLNGTDFETDTIWPYIDPVFLPNAKCLYSKLYPAWTNQYISDCFIPGSEFNYPVTIQSVINDLYYKYPPLIEGQIALLTYQLGEDYYLSLTKIIDYNGTIAFKQISIKINPYFTNQLIINNDTVINGSLEVNDYLGNSIINTDNVNKITSFHTKIGVNQDAHNVKGLIDVNNLSNTNIISILDKFVYPLLYSDDVLLMLQPYINYGINYVKIQTSFQTDVFVFKVPLLNVIAVSDITFLYVPPEPFAFNTKQWNTDSFLKIQTIVNELNKMLPQIELNEETRNHVFSFTELLNDTLNFYLCSLRAVIKTNPNNKNEKEVFFITSFLDVNSTVISDSYTKDFNKIVDKISSCDRLLNFSNLLMLNPSVFDELLVGNSVGSVDPNKPYFSDIINNSPYFRERFDEPSLYMFCWSFLNKQDFINNTDNTCLFHELFTYWNSKTAKNLFIPDKNYKVYDIISPLNINYINNYGYRKNISFLVNYTNYTGPKIAIVNLITIRGITYYIGTGITISDIIDDAIISKGDNKVTGNFSVIDSDTNNPVLNVDTNKNETYSLYKFGIGTNNPKSTLDIKASGLDAIINSVNQLSIMLNNLNNNLPLLVNASSKKDFQNIIETKFKNYNVLDVNGNPSPFIQTNDAYFAIKEIPDKLITKNTIFNYHWLYPSWINQKLKDITDPQYTSMIKNAIDAINNEFNKNNIYNYLLSIHVFDWVFGKKGYFTLSFMNNNKLYDLCSGANLQGLGNNFNDTNVQSFYTTLTAYSYFLQDIILRYNKIPISEIINYQKATDNRTKYFSSNPMQKLVQYQFMLGDISSIKISDFNYDTLQPSNTISYPNITDINFKSRIFLFINNLNRYYTNIQQNTYGILAFEDKFNDFVSLFWCSNYNDTTKVITLISLELQIDTIIQPNLNLIGDLSVEGNAFFKNEASTYLYVDTQNEFLGVNSLEIYGNYANTYTTTTNNDLSKQNVCMTSKSYPNVVAERTNDPTDPSANDYFYFKNFSTFTARRTSNQYTYEELYDYSQKYTSTNKPGLYNAYGSSNNVYSYGPDISYEIKDKTGIIKEIGDLHMVIESVDIDPTTGFTNLRAGFGVAVADTLFPSLLTQEREILHVDNNSCLYVNSIKLGGYSLTVDDNGNLLFNGKKVKLEE